VLKKGAKPSKRMIALQEVQKEFPYLSPSNQQKMAQLRVVLEEGRRSEAALRGLSRLTPHPGRDIIASSRQLLKMLEGLRKAALRDIRRLTLN